MQFLTLLLQKLPNVPNVQKLPNVPNVITTFFQKQINR